jgi:hypothetical protein
MIHNYKASKAARRSLPQQVVVPVSSVPPEILGGLGPGAMILVIGHPRPGGTGAHPALVQHGYRLACLGELDAGLLGAVQPDMVISALIGDGFDAIDVARRLVQLGYRGPYRALSHPLPRPGLVRAEVRAAAPDLDFDLVVVSHGPDAPG